MSDIPIEKKYAALGEMVTRARRLEHESYRVARALGVHAPEMGGVTPALREARRQARQGLPPWSRDVSLEQVEQWIDTALPVLDARNQEVHWETYSRREEGEWTPYRGSLRGGGEVLESSIEDRANLSERAKAAGRVGFKIWQELMLEVRAGVFHWHPDLGRGDDAWVPIVVEINGEYPARPTPEELDAWFQDLRQSSPPAWAAWPAERHEQQRSR